MINHFSETKTKILESAIEISNLEGWDSLSVKKIADQLSFSSAAVYKHFESFDEIKIHMSYLCFEEISVLLIEADSFLGTSSQKLEFFSLLLRKFSLKKPGLFQACMFRSPNEPKELLQLRKKSHENLLKLFSDYSIPDENMISVSRSFRSLLFGSLLLEIRESFGLPEKPEKSYREAISIFITGISIKYPMSEKKND